MKVTGIDLAGKKENLSGIAVLEMDKVNLKNKVSLKTLYSDEEILKNIKEIHPSLIAIDAPLSLPKGRCCLENECECAVGGHFRQAERDIRPYGRVLPLTFKGMKILTLRGIKLAKELRKEYRVIETHPRTSQKMLGFDDLKHDLGRFFKLSEDVTDHELDASLAALTGLLYLKELLFKMLLIF